MIVDLETILSGAVQDHELADKISARVASELAATRAKLNDYRELWLAAPDWWTLDTWREPAGCRCLIGPTAATVADGIAAVQAGACAVLVGPTNCGKSHLAVALARQAIDKSAGRIKDFDFAILHDVHRYRDSDRQQETLAMARRVDVLVYDDAGKNLCSAGGGATPYGNWVYSVMDERAERGRQTIITTRYGNADELRDRLGDDLLRRTRRVQGGKDDSVTILFQGVR